MPLLELQTPVPSRSMVTETSVSLVVRVTVATRPEKQQRQSYIRRDNDAFF